tara:strand:- start:657 stop:1187 length:531 start_codon:yes stop_codon:yes gene_type:complete
MRLKLFSYKKVKSTNDVAIRKIRLKKKQGIIISEEQTNGRGRYGKKWISIKGNLFLTIFFQINLKSNIEKLTIFNCEIVKRALSIFIKKNIKIKYPNDIYLNKKKLCGILQEILNYKGKKYIIIGIGVNIVDSPLIKNYNTTFVNKNVKKIITKDMVFSKLKKFYEINIYKLKKCI